MSIIRSMAAALSLTVLAGCALISPPTMPATEIQSFYGTRFPFVMNEGLKMSVMQPTIEETDWGVRIKVVLGVYNTESSLDREEIYIYGTYHDEGDHLVFRMKQIDDSALVSIPATHRIIVENNLYPRLLEKLSDIPVERFPSR